jgi:peptidoglycan/LPS O-acetylase OafA/YrhL
MKKQIYLEAIRGLAALLVVFTHYFCAFYPASVFGSDYQTHGHWEKLFTTTPLGIVFAGEVAVCLFFILSGYVLSLPYFGYSARDTNHLLAAIIKRPFRLAGIVLASEVAAFFLLRTCGFYNLEVCKVSYSIPWFANCGAPIAVSFKGLVFDLATNAFAKAPLYNSPLWTIEIELYGSFLVFIFLLLFRKSTLRLLAYLYALIYFHGQLYQGFFLGILLADMSRNQFSVMAKFSRASFTYPLLFIGLILASYPDYASQADLAETFYGKLPRLRGLGGGYSMLGALIIFGAVILSASKQRVLEFPLFAFFGRISYALYGFHMLVLGTLSSWLFLYLLPKMGYNESFIPASIYISRYVDKPFTKLADYIGKLWLRSACKTQTFQTNEPTGSSYHPASKEG